MERTGKTPSPRLILWPLCLERLVCAMAMMAFMALVGPLGRLLDLADWQMGAVISAGSLTWFVCASAWGRASDRRGRRPVMLLALAGFVASYALLCVTLNLALLGRLSVLAAFAGLLLWRGLAGVFYAGVLPTSVALIADDTPPQERAGRMALLGVAGGVGMMAGPALVGWMAPWSLLLPLYLLGFLPAVAWLFLWRLLPRAVLQEAAQRPGANGFDPRLRGLALTAFAAMTSVTVAQICVGFYVMDLFALDAAAAGRAAGTALACVGVGLLASQLLVRHLKWPPARLLACGLTVAAAGFGSVLFATGVLLLYSGYFVAACGMGWVWPALSAVAAGRVQAHEQGAAAGVVSSAQAAGAVLGPLLGTGLYALAAPLPYLVIALLLGTLAAWQWR